MDITSGLTPAKLIELLWIYTSTNPLHPTRCWGTFLQFPWGSDFLALCMPLGVTMPMAGCDVCPKWDSRYYSYGKNAVGLVPFT